MSGSALMGIGKTAMYANYAALQAAGNNIANVNTEGYSRQEAQLASAQGQYTGSGFFGKGVSVQTVKRAYDQLLTTQAQQAGSVAAGDAARADRLTQLEAAFPVGKDGLGAAIGNFLNTFVDLANKPNDASTRQVVLSQAQTLAARFQATGDQLATMQLGVTQQVQANVAQVNSLAQQLATMNQQILQYRGTGQTPNDLLDKRDQLVKDIGEFVNVTTLTADDGSIGLFIGGGQNLVLGTAANALRATSDPYDPAKVQLAIREGGTDRIIPGESLQGGSIAGLLRFQNEDLSAANDLLGQMATAVAGALNKQQSLGLDLAGSAGSPLFAVGPPKVFENRANSGTGALSLAVTDPSKVQASTYEVTFDGTNYAVVRQSDGRAVPGAPFTAAQMAAGVSFDGLAVQLTAGTPGTGDRFLLSPVAGAANGMKTVLTNPKGLAAAAPFVASTAAANTGTAAVASLAAVNAAYNPALSATITFTDDAGGYNWSLSDGTSGTGTWSAGNPIALNGFELKLTGVPKSGDALNVAPVTSVAGNNGNAFAFSNLADQGIVGSPALPDGTFGPGVTATDAYAAAIADIGVRVQGGKSAAKLSDAVAIAADAARTNAAGVNLDEEAGKLIQFQQSYQAAAKILQVAQQLFDTLLQTAG